MDAADLDRLTLEPAHASDGPALARLNRQLHAANGHPMTEEEALRRLRMLRVAGYALGLCRLGRATLGYALWRERRSEVYVRHFVIDRPARRRGVGRRFARLMIEALPRDKDVRLDAQTEEAIRFWSSVGFRCEPWGLWLRRGREGAR